METITWILIIVVLLICWLIYPKTFRGFEASAVRAKTLMTKSPQLSNFDSFKRSGGGDVVEFDIMRNLKKGNMLNQTSLTSALLPYESWYRTGS